MDRSVLAQHLRSVGFDTATGVVSLPEALPQEAIHGCGGATCSDSKDQTADAAEPAAQAA